MPINPLKAKPKLLGKLWKFFIYIIMGDIIKVYINWHSGPANERNFKKSMSLSLLKTVRWESMKIFIGKLQ